MCVNTHNNIVNNCFYWTNMFSVTFSPALPVRPTLCVCVSIPMIEQICFLLPSLLLCLSAPLCVYVCQYPWQYSKQLFLLNKYVFCYLLSCSACPPDSVYVCQYPWQYSKQLFLLNKYVLCYLLSCSACPPHPVCMCVNTHDNIVNNCFYWTNMFSVTFSPALPVRLTLCVCVSIPMTI